MTFSLNSFVCPGCESGLVAVFDFEDGTGSSVLTDLTGNGYNGTLTNMDASTDWVSGITCGSCAIADQTLLEADWSDCPGVDSLITLNGSEVGINYYLRDDANNIVIDGPIAGTGSAINLNTGPINSNTTFNVIASQSTIPPGSGGILFDGVDDLSKQNYQFTITGSSDTFSIKAKHKTSNCTLTLNEKSKLSTSGC